MLLETGASRLYIFTLIDSPIQRSGPPIYTGYTIYHADGSEEFFEVDWPLNPTYDDIEQLLAPIIGRPIEHVYVLFEDRQHDMFVNGDGHTAPGGPKPINQAATCIYQAASRTYAHISDPLPAIAGDPVLFHRGVWA